ncbi:hypothetical protein K2173_017744 [Erythroxylum novogranatense]|uniref:Uncharacterized protein n=1 Tax=Erythroxylum novogranatense TaxID=1862640 RepID=A0AAV8SM97_9ROSI|nr:hypothetical protein K2173_017744 [Erythroxylum novogranatense]
MALNSSSILPAKALSGLTLLRSLKPPAKIMDPKMDSRTVSRYCFVDEAIEDGAAPVPISFDKTEDVQCINDIMDHLLASIHYEMLDSQRPLKVPGQHGTRVIHFRKQFHVSSADREDIITCLPYSYCKIIRAFCKAVVSVLFYARTHELKEDLVTMAYGLPLNGDGDEKCL